MLVDLASGTTARFPGAQLPGCSAGRFAAPTVSGVSFSTDDRHLAASTWASSQRYGLTLLFAVQGLGLTHLRSFSRVQASWLDGTPTGVLLFGKHLITRNHGTDRDRLIEDRIMPRALGVNRTADRSHLTSSRITVVGGRIVTGCGGLISREELEVEDRRHSGRAADGLGVVALTSLCRTLFEIRERDLARISRATLTASEKITSGYAADGGGEVSREYSFEFRLGARTQHSSKIGNLGPVNSEAFLPVARNCNPRVNTR